MAGLGVVVTLAAVIGLPGLVPATPSTAAAAAASRPVLLVGGTGTLQLQLDTVTFLDDNFDVYTMTLSPWVGVDRTVSWPSLVDLDADVTLTSLPVVNGAASMATSAQAVERKVTQILNETGADSIDLVGHSQGAPVVRYYVKYLGGLDVVDGVVSLGGVNYGIPRQGDPGLALACSTGAPVCPEIVYREEPGDTEFLTALNNPDPTPGDIDYYHLWTETDEGPGGNLSGGTNVKVQDMCPGRVVFHANEWWDEAMQLLIETALHRELRSDALPPCPN